MASDRPIRRVAIVGTGAVGARWAAFYLARGFDVIATDPEPGAGLAISAIQSACGHPERCVTAHSMDPPHLMPLVEIAAGEKTSPQAVRRALSFYASIGKKPILVRTELPGLAAGRLCAALCREIERLVAQGVLDSADADTVVCWGPGLCWVLSGASAMLAGNRPLESFAREQEEALVALLRLRSKPFSAWKASGKSARAKRARRTS